jgi:hypothetical protein
MHCSSAFPLPRAARHAELLWVHGVLALFCRFSSRTPYPYVVRRTRSDDRWVLGSSTQFGPCLLSCSATLLQGVRDGEGVKRSYGALLLFWNVQAAHVVFEHALWLVLGRRSWSRCSGPTPMTRKGQARAPSRRRRTRRRPRRLGKKAPRPRTRARRAARPALCGRRPSRPCECLCCRWVEFVARSSIE